MEAAVFTAVRSRCKGDVVLCVTLLQGRTDGQCQHRWQKVLNPELVKGPWTKEEDQKVRGAGSLLFWIEMIAVRGGGCREKLSDSEQEKNAQQIQQYSMYLLPSDKQCAQMQA